MSHTWCSIFLSKFFFNLLNASKKISTFELLSVFCNERTEFEWKYAKTKLDECLFVIQNRGPIPSPFCLLTFSFWWKKRDTETQATKIATTAKGLRNYVSRKDYSREKNSTSSNNKRNVTKLKNTPAITFSKTRASITTVDKYHLNISSRQNYPSHLHI